MDIGTLLIATLLVGVGATAVMDLGGMALHRAFGVPPPNYALVGRWIGAMAHGRLRHRAIAAAPPLRAERIIGWTVHYAVGVAFAALLLAIYGAAWVRQPTVEPALVVGIASVAAPFLIMQPAMGSGFASARTPHPWRARGRSLLNHGLFGVGLYVAGCATRGVLAAVGR